MKKSLLSVSAIALLAIACNQTNTAENTTDSNTTTQSIAEQREIITENISYIGTYEGVLPCADCGGIKTTLTVEKSSYTKAKELFLLKVPQVMTKQNICSPLLIATMLRIYATTK